MRLEPRQQVFVRPVPLSARSTFQRVDLQELEADGRHLGRDLLPSPAQHAGRQHGAELGIFSTRVPETRNVIG